MDVLAIVGCHCREMPPPATPVWLLCLTPVLMPVLPLADVFHAGFRRLVPDFTRFDPVLPRAKPSPLKSMERHEKTRKAGIHGWFPRMPAYFVFALIVSAIERVSVHALARLECDGNAGTCHE